MLFVALYSKFSITCLVGIVIFCILPVLDTLFRCLLLLATAILKQALQ